MTTSITYDLLFVLTAGWAVTAGQAVRWWRRLQTDRLTGLGNWNALVRAFRRASRRNRAVGALLIDLDHFKAINDLWGHDAGNTVLRHVAQQLVFHCRSHDNALPVRLHGDEFAVLLTDLPPGADGARAAEEWAHRLAVAIATPVALGAERVAVTGTFGAAVATARAAELSLLLRVADQRMIAAKADRRSAATKPVTGRWSA